MMSETPQVTETRCPATESDTHHLVPERPSGGAMVCRYCGKTQSELTQNAEKPPTR